MLFCEFERLAASGPGEIYRSGNSVILKQPTPYLEMMCQHLAFLVCIPTCASCASISTDRTVRPHLACPSCGSISARVSDETPNSLNFTPLPSPKPQNLKAPQPRMPSKALSKTILRDSSGWRAKPLSATSWRMNSRHLGCLRGFRGPREKVSFHVAYL